MYTLDMVSEPLPVPPARARLSPFLLNFFQRPLQVNEPPLEHECKGISRRTGFSVPQGGSSLQMYGTKKQVLFSSRVLPPSP